MPLRKSVALFSIAPVLLLAFAGCASGPAPSFTLSALPTSVVLANNGPAQPVTVGIVPVNGFTGAVNVTLTGLPQGVTATPTTLTLAPGALQQIMLSSAGAAVATTSTVSIVGSAAGTSFAPSISIPASIQVTPATTSASVSTTSFHFGGDLVGNSMIRSILTVTNTGGSALSMNPSITGDPGFALAPSTASNQCKATVPPGGSCIVRASFTPLSTTPATTTATLNLGFGNVDADTPQTVALSGTPAILTPGVVTPTANPQVAQYTVTLPFPGSVTINFGPDTHYGRSTWTRTLTTAGTVTFLVAGMLPLTTYHMQAAFSFTNGITATDVDQVFTTQDSLLHPQLTAITTPGARPQPGVEQLTFVGGNTIGLVVTDLTGNVLWSYAVANPGVDNQVQGAKLLPNGHFLITLGQGSNLALSSTSFPQGSIDSVREIDLAGNIIRQITTTDLTAELASAGYNLLLEEFHHDIAPLPNGHWLVLSNTLKTFQDLPGYPGATTVLGDVVIDLDTNLQPVWVWNSFDHLDINRRPYAFPDWTHSNAVVYTPDDGNILLSMRHQNWVLKLDYANGAGSGSVLWHLGEGGDFALQNGADPTDWFSTQHFPSLFSAASAGKFSLGLMDNGDDRQFPAGVPCNTPGAPPCLYTTIPVFQLDETAKTASLTFHQILPTSLYSYFGGNTELLANGDIEYDLAGLASVSSAIFEVTNSPTPQTVWQMTTIEAQAYRGYRIPSLYPGVQW